MKRLTYKENLNILYNKFMIKRDDKHFIHKEYSKGEFLINEGDKLENFYFVLSGKIKIYKNYENGKTLLLRIYDSFTILGDVEYFLKKDAQCSVEALSSLKIVKVPFSYIESTYRKNIVFLDSMLLQISEKILTTNDQATLNLIYPLETRLASYILSLSFDTLDNVSLPNLVDVSNHLGTSYRHLHRVMKKLVDQKAIIKNQSNIKIINKKLLSKIARGNVYEDQNESFIEI
ncbi:Crp/Fnr family transcriptional regulator [Mycoplasmatota bacterium WC30]